MKFSHLPHRTLVEISGEDAESFLENLVTCKAAGLGTGEASFGALLTPQGKILFDFFLIRTNEGFLADIDKELVGDFLKRLTFYKLRAKVALRHIEDAVVTACWETSLPEAELVVQDPRVEQMGWRIYSAFESEESPSDYTELRIKTGMPEGGRDFQYGDAYPHETLMDQFAGVDFKKGCYVGQEVVSRMQHRGTAKKRIIKIQSDTHLPKTGTTITADGKPAGVVGSIAGASGLALLRLDRIAKAEEILADGAKISTKLQDWVKFDLPGDE